MVSFLIALAAQTVQATVTRVVDGDTMWAEDAHGTKLRIRLVGVDAPESSPPRKGGGATPGQHDRYKRILGVIYQERTNINLWLQAGYAWYYTGGKNDAPAGLKRELEAAEGEAGRALRGLWQDAHPEPPWLFRRRERLGR